MPFFHPNKVSSNTLTRTGFLRGREFDCLVPSHDRMFFINMSWIYVDVKDLTKNEI